MHAWYQIDFTIFDLVIFRFGARGLAEARGVRPDPDRAQIGPKLGSQLAPTAIPGSKRRQNRDPSTLTLPNGPNITQRSGKHSNKSNIVGRWQMRRRFDNYIWVHSFFLCISSWVPTDILRDATLVKRCRHQICKSQWPNMFVQK